MATFGSFLYGLNSSGKSSLLRAIGVNVILAQGGLFVAASQFCFNPFTKVLSKISSSDNLFRGQSTFILEMCILKEILSKSDTRSLVLCDELTAGTETLSATGIVASSTIQLLNKKSNAVFTTHLHSIMQFFLSSKAFSFIPLPLHVILNFNSLETRLIKFFTVV